MPRSGFQRNQRRQEIQSQLRPPSRPATPSPPTPRARQRFIEQNTQLPTGTVPQSVINNAQTAGAGDDFIAASVPRSNAPIVNVGDTSGGADLGTPTSGAGGFNITEDVPFQGDPFEGAASIYAPGQTSFIYGPEGEGILARDVLAALGFDNPNAGALPSLTDYMRFAQPLALLMAGGAFPTEESVLNFALDFGQQGLTPGGRGIDTPAALAALAQGLSDPNSPLHYYISGPGMDPEDSDRMFRYLLSAATGGLHPVAQRAFMDAADEAYVQYQRAATHGDLPTSGAPYTDYVRQNLGIPGF